MRRRSLPLLSLPLVAGGCLGGHLVGYGLAGQSRRDVALHGYLAYAPFFLATCLTLVIASLALRVAGRLQGRPSAWPFACLPPLAFLLQELLERLAAGFPAHAILEFPVLAGLLAQLPLAALGLALARALLACTDAIAEALAERPAPTFASAFVLAPVAEPNLPRFTFAPFAGFGRAPPVRRSL